VIAEHGFEEVRGLPGPLPKGETVLWQGAPVWAPFSRRAFHLRGLTLYFAALVLWRFVSLQTGGAGPDAVAQGTAWAVIFGMVPICILAAVAWGVERTTVYTITDRRVILKVGVALSMTINLPFAVVSNAALRVYPDGTGDIVLKLVPPHRIFWLALWPHARPWHYAAPEPMLRSIPEAVAVAQILARALSASANLPVPSLDVAPGRPAARPETAVAA
jgi:hypothetical protein